jgi:hypothetical protein
MLIYSDHRGRIRYLAVMNRNFCAFISYTSSGRFDNPKRTSASMRVSGFPESKCSLAAIADTEDELAMDAAILDPNISL